MYVCIRWRGRYLGLRGYSLPFPIYTANILFLLGGGNLKHIIFSSVVSFHTIFHFSSFLPPSLYFMFENRNSFFDPFLYSTTFSYTPFMSFSAIENSARASSPIDLTKHN